MEKQNTCRLCLNNITDSNAEVIRKFSVEAINLVIPNLNFTVSEEPIMCSTCSECLNRCFHFKSMCLTVEDSIKRFTNGESEISLSEVYKKFKRNVEMDTNLEDRDICRLCLDLIASDLNSLKDGVIFDMVHEYLPELNLKLSSNPTMCSACLETFRSYVTFTSACSNVETEIAKYIDSVGLDPNGNVELTKVALFAQRNLDSVTDGNTVKTEIKTEMTLMENVKTETTETWDRQYLPQHVDCGESRVCRWNEGEQGFRSEMQEVKCEIKDETAMLDDVKMEPNDSENDQEEVCDYLDFGVDKVEVQMEEKPQHFSSSGATKNEDSTSSPPAHDPAPSSAQGAGPSQPLPAGPPYKCPACPYTTKYPAYLARHAKRHKGEPTARRRKPRTVPTAYTCPHCDYSTPHRYRLREHALTHMAPSEVQLFECQHCGLKTKWLSTLRKHSLIHKDESEVATFSCDLCPYTSKSKEYLKQHLAVHKSLPVLQCGSCSFRTKYESYLRRHASTHEAAPSGEEPRRGGAHVCPSCGYGAGRKSRLREHMLTHQDGDEARVYRCERCGFQTKWRNSFKKHGLVHEPPPPGGAAFACQLCDYRATSRGYLNKHSMVHKDAAQMRMQRCAVCGFETKTKHNLKSHMLRHAGPGAGPAFECASCGYRTRRKAQLVKHMARHKGELAGKAFGCGECAFETNWAQSLRAHEATHKE